MNPSGPRIRPPMTPTTARAQDCSRFSFRQARLSRALMPADSTPECVADVHAVLGEGPVWVADEQALYWVDIKGRKIFRLDESGKRDEWPTPMRVGSLAPRVGG